jgi:hypothetical protein
MVPTSSPIFHLITPQPTASTTPEHSRPGYKEAPGGGGYLPCLKVNSYLGVKDKKAWTFHVQLLNLESRTTSLSCHLHLLFAHRTNVHIFKSSRNGNHRWQQFFFMVATWKICKGRERGRGRGKTLQHTSCMTNRSNHCVNQRSCVTNNAIGWSHWSNQTIMRKARQLGSCRSTCTHQMQKIKTC